MKYHINNTSRPITYKTWALDPQLIEKNHFKTLHSHDISAKLEPNSVVSFGTVQHWMWSDSRNYAELETYSDEQEVVLQLLYSGNLVLLQVQTVLPNSISTWDFE